jgi:Phenazine biosynthesis protein A/B
MTIASDLLQRHIQTLVDDNMQWQTLIADDVLWELAYAPSIGHPAQLSGREEAVRHAIWFVGAVENFRFFELKVYTLADPELAVAEVKGRGSSSLRDVCIARIMCYFCVLQAARSRSYENISILCARQGHLTRRSLVSNPE